MSNHSIISNHSSIFCSIEILRAKIANRNRQQQKNENTEYCNLAAKPKAWLSSLDVYVSLFWEVALQLGCY